MQKVIYDFWPRERIPQREDNAEVREVAPALRVLLALRAVLSSTIRERRVKVDLFQQLGADRR